MSSPADLVEALEALAARLDDRARVKLGRSLGAELRRLNAERIRANRTPEGAPMVPRKARRPAPAKLGKPPALDPRKRGRMFRKAATNRYLRVRAAPEELQLGYFGTAATILIQHQEGGTYRVSRDTDAQADYPARPLLGLPPEDRARILDRVAQLL
ncbi:MAG: hypothetical protein A4S12_07040 [Proteobacteria bacterium SG_bin5]|nr:phage virion morphogenesis protein [Sphingomonas sp.]OQW42088.1 MAG: hypothetical protein A4S12_07040 [Proteobacteria bacterium SG_bin5]